MDTLEINGMNPDKDVEAKLAEYLAANGHWDFIEKNCKKLPDGNYEDRWRPIKTNTDEDKAFVAGLNPKDLPSYIEAEGDGYKINISRVPTFGHLNPAFQKDNMDAAKIDANLAVRTKNGEKFTRNQVGKTIHDGWMQRNAWQKDSRPELFEEFENLTEEEQQKDIDRYEFALSELRKMVEKSVGTETDQAEDSSM